MNLLYVFGSEAELKSTFIQREITELQNLGIELYFFVIDPFYRKNPYTRYLKIFKATLNPFYLLINPFINHFVFKRSYLFSEYNSRISRGFEKEDIHPFKIFAATILAESALNKLLSSKIRIQHIHTHHLFSAALFTPSLAKFLGAGYSISVHTLSHYLKPDYLKNTLNEATFIRTLTSETNTYFKKNHFNNNICLIHNSVDPEAFSVVYNTKAQTKKLTVLAIGKFLDKKGFDILIESCKILYDYSIDFNCIIIGEGPEKKLLKDSIIKYGLKDHVKLLPFMDFSELIPYFQRSTVLAVPSRNPKRSTRDGLPTVILEAMAMGLPVVSSDFAGISDSVIHEKTGLLVESENPNKLAAAILRIYTEKELTKELIENAKSHVEQKFSLKKNIGQLAELFKKMQ